MRPARPAVLRDVLVSVDGRISCHISAGMLIYVGISIVEAQQPGNKLRNNRGRECPRTRGSPPKRQASVT